ncbi:hypothetical protein C7S18_10195 [Ahniella affigens]|uniref:Uncharacterized protein n=1 Tax=Ahniella affigens TaxID=2021234 RepID=A0A2P1PRU2_9GAMM|nr:hypothetical protein C7S18_10195 [Ahniella affigens]
MIEPFLDGYADGKVAVHERSSEIRVRKVGKVAVQGGPHKDSIGQRTALDRDSIGQPRAASRVGFGTPMGVQGFSMK